MAYIIRVLDHTPLEVIICRLTTKLLDSPFKAQIFPRGPGFEVQIKFVRLKKAKEYCGQHWADTCDPNQKRKKMTYLEREDWIAFNGLVNDVLDDLEADANVTTNPQECVGKLWIRKGRARRKKYDWEMKAGRYGRPVEMWDLGSPSQF